MAKKEVVLLLDDLDGGEADETVHFSIDGISYEIDLKAANAKKLRDVFQPFVDKARKAGSGRPRAAARRQRTAESRERSAEIRAWAKENGIEVHPRGRIPGHVVEQYLVATGQA